MYLLLDGSKRVYEIIPEENPVFPGVGIEKRYPAEMVAQLVRVDDNTEIGEGYRLNEETGKWEYTAPEEPVREPEPDMWEELAGVVREGVNEV